MARKELSQRRKLFNNIAGLAILGGLGWFIWHISTADDRTRELCDSIKPGTTIQELNAFLTQQGTGSPVTHEGSSFIRGEGFDYACKLEIVAGRVLSSSLHSTLPDEENIGK